MMTDHEGPPAPRTRPARSGVVVGIAAVTAAVVGGSAGYAGARLGATAASPTVATSPTTASSAPSDPSPTSPSSTSPSSAAPDPVAAAKKLVASTVTIKVGDSTGSGFVLDRKGRIMTNNHVVARAARGSRITVTFANGRRRVARLVGRSPSYDIAVVKVSASTPLRPVQVGDSRRVQVGQPVLAVGAPFALSGTVTQGIVSSDHRAVVVDRNAQADTPKAYIDAIQTDAPINPGNSGGPLATADARVIGVNSAILTVSADPGAAGNVGVGFAIPINQAVTVGRQLISRGKATYPVLGADADSGRSGVRLSAVTRSGPAHKAGLRNGDVVTRVGDQRVRRAAELIVSIRTRRPGDKVVLDYTRGAHERTARVRLGRKEG